MKKGIKKAATVLNVLMMLIFVVTTSTVKVQAEEQVKSIEIKKYPTKCTYNIGEGYTTKGMVVEAKLSNGKKQTVDNSEITSFSGVELTEGRPFEQEGWKGVTIKYKGVETSYGVTVFDPAKDYYIKYNSDGGSKVKSSKLNASTKAFNLPKPTKKGSVFLGWYHSNGQKYTKYEQGMGPNLEFTAKWGHKIIYNANGGRGTMKSGVIKTGYMLPKCGFKRSGYKFVGWGKYKSVTQPNDFYTVGTSSTFVENNKGITLYAQWVKPATYTLSYSTKGVKMPKKVLKKYTSGKTTMLPSPDATGYEMSFMGWKVTKNGKNYGTFTEIPPYMTGNLKLTPVLYKFQG